MLNPKMEERLNKHMNAEFYASYLYLSMSAYFAHEGLGGFARWLKLQSEEETGHAMRFYGYINEQNGRVVLHAIEKPTHDFKNYVEVFENILGHEQKVTRQINELMELAIDLKDHATQVFLQWFVTEQVEEEDMAGDALQKVQMVQDHGPGILALDREFGARQPG
jgi:ferritin